ncbi:hypothetical protein FRB99_001740 [Tulasnella sp. 403]|nr:hypothetical protein FRB99_001740 [Tulasnella sp. 403]
MYTPVQDDPEIGARNNDKEDERTPLVVDPTRAHIHRRPRFTETCLLYGPAIVLFLFVLALIFNPQDLNDVLVPPGSVPVRSFSDAATINYEAVAGFFVQDKPSTNATKVGPVPARLGLIDDSKHYWTSFKKKIRTLNKEAKKGTSYKVLFLGRHGEGYHNVGQEYYGLDAWDANWGRLNGNGTMTWGPDAQLTSKGISQIIDVNNLLAHELAHHGGIPLPTRLFVSSLSRALHTLQISYSNLIDVVPLVKEGLRDTYGLRTSDKRHTKSWISEVYPAVKFEEGFEEEDLLWVKDARETDEHFDERAKKAFEEILRVEDTYIGIVAHNNIVNAVLKFTKHVDFEIATGGVIPLVVKVTIHDG